MTPMDRDLWARVEPLLEEAMDLAAEERGPWLARLREASPDLAPLIEDLLEQESGPRGSWLEGDIAELFGDRPGLAGQPIGSYTLEAPIGQGGMGSVWLASRNDGRFQQQVAIKLLNLALVGRAADERFAQERRILALLESPRITRLIDGGVTDDGLPWFAMEYVEGEPIDQYCDGRALPIPKRLELFVAVCEGVQYAHQRLVVHRDLKPSNILVTAEGEVKLLDFGIAKLLDPLAGPAEGLTRTGAYLMTPEYAAPEQVRGQPIGAATDVYALGVLLYRLLTGTPPYDIRGLSLLEVERAICETEPPDPSSTFGARPERVQAGSTRAPVDGAARDLSAEPAEPVVDQANPPERARLRSSSPDKLRRRLRGDLDLIVRKAMRKEPDRRYPSAAALAADVLNFLEGRPVLARPDSAAYRLRKFVRRNRVAVIATTTTLLALIGATVFSTAQMREARRQRDAARQDARRAQATANVQSVLLSDARGPGGRLLTVIEQIELAERMIIRKYAREPGLASDLLAGLAERLYELGERDRQRATLATAGRLALDADLPSHLARADCDRAYSFAYDDRFDSARVALAEATRALGRARPPLPDAAIACLDAEGVLLLAEGQPDSGLGALRRAAVIAKSTPGEPRYLQILNDMAGVLRALGRTREGADYQLQILAELDSTGFAGTEILSNVATFLVSSLNELGELSAIDSVLGALVRERRGVVGPDGEGSPLAFLYGFGKLRLRQLDSADFWITRALADTTEGYGLTQFLPPVLTQLRLEQHRPIEARNTFAVLPAGTMTRRVNSAWLGAWLRREEGDRLAPGALEDSLRVLSADGLRPVLALPLLSVAEWRLAGGEFGAADSLAGLARTAAAVDSIALSQSAWVGRAELIRARARAALGEGPGARDAASHAVIAIDHAFGARSGLAAEAHALRDSLTRIGVRPPSN
jgi:eukaryotic-like serine/threonine-protein kinase